MDPDYPLPWVGLSDLYTVQAIYGYEREVELRPKASAAIERALSLNNRLGDTHRALGFVQMFFDWDLKAATKSFERSIELDPSSGLSHAWLGWASMWPGRKDAAVAAVARAAELDPLNIYVMSISAGILDGWGLRERACENGQRVLDMEPNYLVGLYLAGGVYSRLGRHREALDAFSRGVEVSGRAAFFLGYHAWAQAMAGDAAGARDGLAELELRSATEYVAPLFKAMVHAALGEMERAFELLEEAVDSRNAWLATPRLPLFDGFRKDPRFAEHLRRIGHPDTADGQSD